MSNETTKELELLVARVHKAHINWWRDIHTGEPIKRNLGELLALVISELSEALEGERKNLMDDKLTHRRMAEVELADAKIRILDLAGGFGLSLFQATPAFYFNESKGESLLKIMKLVVDAYGTYAEYYLSKALAMIDNYAKHFGHDVDGAFEEKLSFNETREDHTHEHRRTEHGKKF